MEYLLIFGSVALASVLMIFVMKSQDREIDKITKRHLELIRNSYPDAFGGSYTFYTDNHPYVWGEIEKEAITGLVRAAATGFRGIPQDPPIYCYEVDDYNKRFYFIAGQKRFDFKSLKHYQEWLDSQKEVAENIRKYNAS
ncbi:hypothetical protein [Microbulbifer sp. JMSA003]|uniref:hypothetical protein n=1 Tax=Microbulbifer sp. JMSA003 TaxID=3243369 RepID=UPI00403925A5